MTNTNIEKESIFCDCGKLLENLIEVDRFLKICNMCNIQKKPSKKDTLIYESMEEKKDINSISKNKINKVLKDNLEIKIKEKCNQCNNMYKKTTRNKNLTLIKICTKCKNIE